MKSDKFIKWIRWERKYPCWWVLPSSDSYLLWWRCASIHPSCLRSASPGSTAPRQLATLLYAHLLWLRPRSWRVDPAGSSALLRRGVIRVCKNKPSCHLLLAARLKTPERRSHLLNSSALIRIRRSPTSSLFTDQARFRSLLEVGENVGVLLWLRIYHQVRLVLAIGLIIPLASSPFITA